MPAAGVDAAGRDETVFLCSAVGFPVRSGPVPRRRACASVNIGSLPWRIVSISTSPEFPVPARGEFSVVQGRGAGSCSAVLLVRAPSLAITSVPNGGIFHILGRSNVLTMCGVRPGGCLHLSCRKSRYYGRHGRLPHRCRTHPHPALPHPTWPPLTDSGSYEFPGADACCPGSCPAARRMRLPALISLGGQPGA